MSTTPEALFSERERNVENDEDSIFIYAYIPLFNQCVANWSRVRDALFLFFCEGGWVRCEKLKFIHTFPNARKNTDRTRRINTTTSNKNKNNNIKRTRKDKRKGYGA